jgi:hypothetical protein
MSSSIVAPTAPDGGNGNTQGHVVTIIPYLLASKWSTCVSEVEVILVESKVKSKELVLREVQYGETLG